MDWSFENSKEPVIGLLVGRYYINALVLIDKKKKMLCMSLYRLDITKLKRVDQYVCTGVRS